MINTTAFTKRALIDKAGTSIVIATTIAAFVCIFAIIAGKSLWAQISYQNRVISAKKATLSQLKADLTARDGLQKAYNAFASANPNVLLGNISGTGPNDGDNATIALDALPDHYDFPALATSLEKLVSDQNVKVISISGTDNEISQGANVTSPDPQPVAMPFQLQASGSYQAIQGLLDTFQRSIRPFKIQTLTITGDASNMTVSVSAQTYYQPGKTLNIQDEVVQ